MTRIGILGGTFDPPHIGHLLLAEFAADALAIDRVLFVPAANPPHKPGTVRVSAAHRLAMVSLAVGSNPLFALSLIDIDRPGPHYTVDLLGILCDQYPDAELYFILGSDSLRSLPQWRQPDELIRRARLAVVERPGARVDVKEYDAILPGLSERATAVDSPLMGISSTEIVNRLQSGRSIRYLVPDTVLRYIETHGLYR